FGAPKLGQATPAAGGAASGGFSFGSGGTGFGGGATGSGFGGLSFGGNQQQQQQQQQPFGAQGQQGFGSQLAVPTVEDKFREIESYWNVNSPNCQFKHYFYNMVHPNEVQRYSRPPNHDATLYDQAMQDNPDPSCMVPVLAVGFEDIKKRIAQQDEANRAHRAKLEEIDSKLDSLERKHQLETTVKLDEFRRRHTELARRVLFVMRRVHVLRNKGYPIRAEEEALRVRLEAL
ncbi:hypothetical protein HK101_005585, partial [Irineochytrium annulatum]